MSQRETVNRETVNTVDQVSSITLMALAVAGGALAVAILAVI